MSDLIEDNQIIISFSFNLLPFYCWTIWKISGHTHICNWKRKTYFLITFSGNFGYSFLLVHQNPICDNFLKIYCSVENEIVPVNFSHTVALKTIGLSCILNGFVNHAWFFSNVHWSFGKDWFRGVIHIFQCRHFIITYFLKNHTCSYQYHH